MASSIPVKYSLLDDEVTETLQTPSQNPSSPTSPKRSVSFSLVFENVCLSCKKRPQPADEQMMELQLDDVNVLDYRLNNVSGIVKSGEILAIMGSSGAGKTTLLDIISGTEKHNSLLHHKLSGELFSVMNKGSKVGHRPIIGYVTQESLFLHTQTVIETMWTHAQLRLPQNMSELEKKERIDEVLSAMGLNACRHVRIGSQGKKGISGGEKKRLQVACELLQKPDILFLDEPTSGLDCQSAEKLLDLLRIVAEQGCAVVCTIHQPRYSIFNKLDNLLILAHGMPMYFGPVLKATEYFSEIGYPCPLEENPADFLIDLVTVGCELDGRKPFIETLDDIPQKCQKFYQSKYGVMLQKDIANAKAASLPKFQITRKQKIPTSMGWQISTLLKRQFIHYIREPSVMLVKLVEAVLIALLIGSIFWDSDNHVMQDTAGALFFCLVWVAITAFGSTSYFINGRLLANQEYISSIISIEAYYINNMVFNTATMILYDCFYSLITFYIIRFHGFQQYFLIVFLVHIAAESGIIFASVVGNTVEESFFIGAVLIIFPLLFAGFYRQLDRLPVHWQWAQHVSWGKYAMQLALVNQFSDSPILHQVHMYNHTFVREIPVDHALGYGDPGLSTNQQFTILLAFSLFWRLMPYLAMKIKVLITGRL